MFCSFWFKFKTPLFRAMSIIGKRSLERVILFMSALEKSNLFKAEKDLKVTIDAIFLSFFLFLGDKL